MIQIKDIFGNVIAEVDAPRLSMADLRGMNLENADFRGQDMKYTILYDANLKGADLRGADLRCTFVSTKQKCECIHDETTIFRKHRKCPAYI